MYANCTESLFFAHNIANSEQKSASCLDLWKHVGPFVRVVAIAFSLENPNRAAADQVNLLPLKAKNESPCFEHF